MLQKELILLLFPWTLVFVGHERFAYISMYFVQDSLNMRGIFIHESNKFPLFKNKWQFSIFYTTNISLSLTTILWVQKVIWYILYGQNNVNLMPFTYENILYEKFIVGNLIYKIKLVEYLIFTYYVLCLVTSYLK